MYMVHTLIEEETQKSYDVIITGCQNNSNIY